MSFLDSRRFLPIMSGEDDYYLGKDDLFFHLRKYLLDRTATKRIFLFCRRRRGQFKSGLTPISGELVVNFAWESCRSGR